MILINAIVITLYYVGIFKIFTSKYIVSILLYACMLLDARIVFFIIALLAVLLLTLPLYLIS
jgi:hypothetical protein